MVPLQKSQKREAIVGAALQLVHRQGFNHTSLDDILSASGAGKGQFYYYFENKEALGMAVIDRAAAQMETNLLQRVARGQGLEAIDWMLSCLTETVKGTGCGSGCLMGNLAAEMSDLHEGFRQRLAAIFETWRESVEVVLMKAQERGEVGGDIDLRACSRFILATIEGAILMAKVQHDASVMEESFQELRKVLRLRGR